MIRLVIYGKKKRLLRQPLFSNRGRKLFNANWVSKSIVCVQV